MLTAATDASLEELDHECGQHDDHVDKKHVQDKWKQHFKDFLIGKHITGKLFTQKTVKLLLAGEKQDCTPVFCRSFENVYLAKNREKYYTMNTLNERRI